MVVEPIRDKNKIELMKKILQNGPFGERNHLLFVLGINSGLRISDLLKLKVSDVVDEKGKVRQHISLYEQKTGKYKKFPLGKAATAAIKEYLKAANPEDTAPDRPLFPSRKGTGAISRVHAWEILSGAAKEAGVADQIGTHTLRKTFGYHARKAGVGIEVIQTILNHSSPAVTMRYIGITQDEIDDVYINLNL
jgi:site-specific recombinase XerD